MSNYTKITDFAAKDTLPTGSAGKVIRGSEFETEFDNIATAITSKANKDGETLVNVNIDSGTIDGTNIGANVAGTGDFTTLTASTLTATTADINGGTIDSTVIGGTTPAAATVSTLTAASLAYPTSDGSAGQFLKTDGAGTLSFASTVTEDLMTLDLTADASGVAANKFVQVNSDGTVTQVTGSNADLSSDILTEIPYYDSYYGNLNLVRVSSANKWIYIGTDDNYYVLDLTGSAPTVSSGASVPGTGTIINYHWNSTDSVFVVLRGTEIYAATLSGTTLTFGSAADVSSYTGVTSGSKYLFYDERSNSSLFLWTGYEQIYDPGIGEMTYDWQDFDAHVLSFSGTTITVNAGNELISDANLGGASFIFPTLLPRGLYNHQGASTSFLLYNRTNSSTFRAMTIAVSGTTVTAGAENTLTNLTSETTPALGAFWDSTNSDFLFLSASKYWTVSISAGTITTSADNYLSVASASQYNTGPWVYNSSTGRYIQMNYAVSGQKLSKSEYTWNGSTLTLQSTVYDFIDYITTVYSYVYDPTGDNEFIIARKNGTSDYYGFFYNAVGSTNLASYTAKSTGYSLTTAAAGETVTVKFGYSPQGGFTGLTPATLYYIDNTGQPSTSPGSQTVLAGWAITSTTLMLAKPTGSIF